MRRSFHSAVLAVLVVSVVRCSSGTESNGQPTTDSGQPTTDNQQLPTPLDSIPRLPFPIVDDNVFHDTLAVQVTFDLMNDDYLMVASNMEETFEGLRLYRYRMNKNDHDMLAVSSPAYDSWTMLPTFFPADNSEQRMWVLANFGEKQSWGQKLMILDKAFSDIGFLDVALPQRAAEGDSLYLKRGNVAPHLRMARDGTTTVFFFACDSVYLYDDQQGGTDRVLPGSSVRYLYSERDGLRLWLDGRVVPVKKPA